MTLAERRHFAKAEGSLTRVRGVLFDLRRDLTTLQQKIANLEESCLAIEQELHAGFEAREEGEDDD